jgi:phospholipase C
MLFACAACAAQPGTGPLFANHQIEGALKIKHVVWIMQENRSFDNLFQGYPGSDTSSSGKDSHGHTI